MRKVLMVLVVLGLLWPSSANAATAGFSVSLPKSTDEVAPGGMVQTAVTLTNATDKKIVLSLRNIAVESSPNGGVYADTPLSRDADYVGTDLPPSIGVDAEATSQVVFRIPVPKSFEAGLHLFGIQVSSDNGESFVGALPVTVEGSWQTQVNALNLKSNGGVSSVGGSFDVQNTSTSPGQFIARVDVYSGKNKVGTVSPTGNDVAFVGGKGQQHFTWSYKPKGLVRVLHPQLIVSSRGGSGYTDKTVSLPRVVFVSESLLALVVFIIVALAGGVVYLKVKRPRWAGWLRRR